MIEMVALTREGTYVSITRAGDDELWTVTCTHDGGTTRLKLAPDMAWMQYQALRKTYSVPRGVILFPYRDKDGQIKARQRVVRERETI